MRTKSGKHFPIAVLPVMILIFTMISGGVLADSVVTFTCPALETMIRQHIDVLEGDILESDLAALTILSAAYCEISSLSGIEYCANLTSLDLKANQFVDLSPVAGLTNLEDLILEENQISDISSLSSLSSLQMLDLSNNQITDIGSLVANPDLGSGDTLNLMNNPLGSNDLSDIQELESRGVTVYHDADTADPEVQFTSPTSASSYTSDSATVDIAGTASDDVAVTEVKYQVNDGDWLDCSGTTSWSKAGITLSGENTFITVRAYDAAGNYGIAAIVVTYTAAVPAALDFTVPDLDGNMVNLADYHGKAVILNFWATWCEPCHSEIADLIQINTEYGGDDFTVIGLSYDDEGATATSWCTDNGVNYSVYMRTYEIEDWYGQQTAEDYIQNIPTTFFIDQNGDITGYAAGPRDYNYFRSIVEDLLEIGSGDDWDPGDDTAGGATALTVTTDEQHHGPHTLSATDIVDWYKIDMTAGYAYTFKSTFTGETSAPAGSGDVKAWLYSDSSGISHVTADDDSGGNYQFKITYTAAATQTYYLKVRTYNEGSEWSGSISYKYEVPDTEAPTVIITGPTSGSTCETEEATVTISGTGSDNTGITKVEYCTNNGAYVEITFDGTTSITWSTDDIPLTEGDNTITVKAHDAAGNIGSDAVVVTCNRVTVPAALDFTVPDLEGNMVHLADYSGKAIILNIWATWYEPCQAEITDLIQLHTDCGGDDFTVIGLSLDDESAIAASWCSANGVNYPVYMRTQEIEDWYGQQTEEGYIQEIPASFFINTAGEITGYVFGARDYDYFRSVVDDLPDSAVTFTCSALETIIRENIEVLQGDILESDLAALTILSAAYCEINDLTGIEECDNLASLDLKSNLIVDISPLAELGNIENLILEDNQICDIGPLSAISSLKLLDLSGNQIIDIGALVANPGLGSGDIVILSNNPLGSDDLSDIQELENRGVTVSHSIDTEAPVIYITSPTSASVCETIDELLDVSGIASDNAGIAAVELSVNDGAGITCEFSGSTEVTWSASGLQLAEGVNTILVEAFDTEGNCGTHTLSVLYTSPAGVIWHVASGGSDASGDGSAESPFATIGKGLDSAGSGDVVKVGPGTYLENVVMKQGVDLMGADRATTVIDAQGYGDVVDARANDAAISGFTLKNSGVSDLGHNNSGIYVSGAWSPTIKDNVIIGNRIGIGIWSGAEPDISNCIITDNYDGIYVYGSPSSPGNPVIVNNSIVGHQRAGILLREHVSPVVSNNIISGNASGINLNYVTGTPAISYNNVWNNGVNYSRDNIADNTLAGAGALSADPLLDDSFNLMAGSPCINAGNPDLDGDDLTWDADSDDQNPDGTRLDMGALFFNHSIDNEAPSITIIEPTGDEYLDVSSSPLDITGTASDNMHIAHIRYQVGDGEWIDCVFGSSTSVTWYANGISLETGENTVTVRITDDAGNYGEDTLDITYAPEGSVPAALNFTVPDLQGDYVNLSDYSGKVVILNFWATWSEECLSDIPNFIALQDEFGGDAFTVIGISSDNSSGSTSTVSGWCTENGVNYPVFLQTPALAEWYGQQTEEGRIQSIPTTFFINSDGEIEGHVTGARGYDYFHGVVLDLLGIESEDPVVVITSPVADDTFVTVEGMVQISGEASDDTGIKTIQYRVNEGSWVNCEYSGVSSIAWSTGGISMVEGENLITVRAYDTEDNYSEDAITVTYALNTLFAHEDSPAMPIPDNGGADDDARWMVELGGAPDGTLITGIDVEYRISHTYISDLVVYLTTQENGEWIHYQLWNRAGGGQDNLHESVSGIAEWNGLAANRTWYLVAYDGAAQDTGEIEEWKIWVHYAAEAPPQASRNFGLLVGINEYSPDYGVSPLGCCVNDVEAMKSSLLKDPSRWNESRLTDLTNGSATESAIRQELSALAETAVSGDVVLYYHSGHGGRTSGTDTFLCAHDGEFTDSKLADEIAGFETGVTVIIIIDACHSGGMFKNRSIDPSAASSGGGGWDFAGNVMRKLAGYWQGKMLARSPSIGWITSCDYDQISWEFKFHGIFSWQIITAFSEGDSDDDGSITFLELYEYAAPRIAEITTDQEVQVYGESVLSGTIATGEQETCYSVTVSTEPENGGSVSINPDKDCYQAGDILQITASPGTGYVFARWSGDIEGDANPAQLQVDSDKTVIAHFIPETVSLSEALDTDTFTWTIGGNADWTGQKVECFNGGDAVQSGAIEHRQTSWLQTTATGPGTLSFAWKVSSEQGFDYLKFYVDGAVQEKISGDPEWSEETYSLGEGTYTVKWAYEKDESGTAGMDRGWVDKIGFEPIVTYSISGIVETADGRPVHEVDIDICLGQTCFQTIKTNSIGSYRKSGIGNGTYTVTPSKAGYLFDPETASVAIDGGDARQSFTASLVPAQKIFGTVTPSNVSIQLFASGEIIAETTAVDGTYEFASGLTEGTTYTVRAYQYTSETVGYYPKSESVTFTGDTVVVDFQLERVPMPTISDSSCAFYGNAEHMDTDVLVGDVIAVYDPDGVLCGVFIVDSPGQYGLVTVYGDDSLSTADEGADDGDVLKFSVNGVAVPANPTFSDATTGQQDLATEDGSISGSITPYGAKVELWQEAKKLRSTVATNGTFAFDGLEVGATYRVRAYSFVNEVTGYYPVEESVEITALVPSASLSMQLPAVPVLTMTDSSVSFYGTASYRDTDVLAGDVLVAKDTDGVACGVYIVQRQGEYGIITVYGDESSTPDTDEGAEEGEELSFLINRSAATAQGPGEAVFNDGQNICLDLSASGDDTLWKFIPLHASWNCVTVSLVPETDGFAQVFSGVTENMVIARKYADDGVKVFDPVIPERFNTLTTVETGCGYQIKMLEDGIVEVCGTTVPPTTQLTILSGWNVIPYYGTSESAVGTFLEAIKSDIIIVRGYHSDGVRVYDPTIPERFNTLTVMEPPFAYQIKMKDTQPTYTLTP